MLKETRPDVGASGKKDSLDAASCADWLADQEGLELPVSREVLLTENGTAVGDLSRGNRSAPSRDEFAFSFGRSSFVNLEFRCREIPYDELPPRCVEIVDGEISAKALKSSESLTMSVLLAKLNLSNTKAAAAVRPPGTSSLS